MSFSTRFRLVLLAGLVLLLAVLVSQEINLVTADLGRHLKNGELVLQGKAWQIWQTNFYSFTYSQFPFVNHHWGSGVVFYLIQQFFGFTGLSVFFSLITLATFLIFFRLAWKNSRFSIAFLAAILVLPILVSRGEIRPEVFSCFLAGICWWILSEGRQKRKLLWSLPFLTLLWVNLHLYFFLGFFLIGTFFLEELISLLKKARGLRDLSYLKSLGVSGGFSLLACLVNPAGLKGVFYPFQIFNNFGYRLFENQSVWFLDKIVQYPPSLYFKIAFGALALSWLYVLWTRKRLTVHCFLFTVFFSYLGWTAVRNFTLFGYFALPILATNLKVLFFKQKETETEYFVAASLAALTLFGLFFLNSSYWANRISLGLGLKEGNGRAAEFFLKENLKGPIFNNYDNGGYLIYFLYPQKVFVDNRPEAYPKDFFEKIYIPMQESEEKWQAVEKEYQFNTIFFFRHDLTPWGQNFLIKRIKDSTWAPVYVDDWSIIFLKRNKENEALIQKYELPKEIFSISK